MKKLGIDFRKVGVVPVEANVGERAKFLAEELGPRLRESCDGGRALFFVDAAHLVLAPFIGYLWSFERLFLKAPAGRRRFNVPGVPNAVTPELVAVTNETYINAARVCELLGKIAAPAMAVPTALVLGNSRYQRCKAVMECANSLGIEPLFLPPYSPNLNLASGSGSSSKRSACTPNTTRSSPPSRQPSPSASTNLKRSTRKNWRA